MTNRLKIAVIGNGGWGTANALLLVGYGHDVTIWGHDTAYVEACCQTRRSEKYLPGIELPAALKLTADREAALAGADVVVLAPPSKYFSSVMEGFRGLVTDRHLVVSLTKGLCEKTNRRMTDLGRGEPIVDILASMQMVAEGYWNSKVIHAIARRLGVEMPICELVYALCHQSLDIQAAATAIMSRDLKAE